MARSAKLGVLVKGDYADYSIDLYCGPIDTSGAGLAGLRQVVRLRPPAKGVPYKNEGSEPISYSKINYFREKTPRSEPTEPISH
jgi:hypothetical protein